MRFSQRIGKTPIKVELEREGLSLELKNLLWNHLIISISNNSSSHSSTLNIRKTVISRFAVLENDEISCAEDYIISVLCKLWINYFRKSISNLPFISHYQNQTFYDFKLVLDEYEKIFYNSEWYESLDLIEQIGKYFPFLHEQWNSAFEQEMSAYRFVNGEIIEINSKEEIAEIEQAINDNDQFNAVKIHLETALTLMSNRENPDYRNSIKESISAIESIVKKIINDDKATLGQALKRVQERHNLPNALKEAFNKLYGYTSDEGGIRHALTDDSIEVTYAEARFMLIACSAFINYLKLKAEI